MRQQAEKLIRQGAFIPAIPLALDANRQFDEAAQRRLIRYYLACGVDGIAAAVHTTQFEIRDPQHNLLETVLRVAIDEIRAHEARTGRTVIAVAGACGPAQQAAQEARQAHAMGYDAALLSPRVPGQASEADLIARTRAVAQEADVIGFYLQPAVGGRVLSYDYWQALCAVERVVAIKCAAFNRYYTNDVARAIAFSGRDIALYTGNDDSILVDLLTEFRFADGAAERSVRVVGGLLGHWSVWTHTAVQLFREIRQLDPCAPVDRKWLTLAAQVTDANGAFFDAANAFEGCIPGVHEVLRRQGLLPGVWCLDEGLALSPGQAEEITRVHDMYPHLHDDAFAAAFLAAESNHGGGM